MAAVHPRKALANVRAALRFAQQAADGCVHVHATDARFSAVRRRVGTGHRRQGRQGVRNNRHEFPLLARSHVELHIDPRPLEVQAGATMMQPVLLVEDHPLVAHAMVGELTRSNNRLELHVAPDAATAMRQLMDPSREWHRIFLDLDVPGAHGLSLAREIQRNNFEKRCCVVSALSRTDLIAEIRLLGFLGYIVKASSFAEFKRAIAQVMSGDRTFPSLEMDARTLIRLSRRQEQMLDCVRRGMSSKEIARVVFLSEGTVNNCINAALRALDVSSRSHAVAKALELGLLAFDTRDSEPAATARIDRRSA